MNRNTYFLGKTETVCGEKIENLEGLEARMLESRKIEVERMGRWEVVKVRLKRRDEGPGKLN